MKYRKPDIILEKVDIIEDEREWIVKIRILFRNMDPHLVLLKINMEQNKGDGTKHLLTISEAADQAQRIVANDLLATAALNADWLDDSLREIIYEAFPAARP